MSRNQKTVLITGANRGSNVLTGLLDRLGFGLTKLFLSRGYKVIAAVRDISSMVKLDGVIFVKIDAESLTDPKQAVETLQAEYGIKHLDIVIANSGICSDQDPISSIDPESFTHHFNINTRGPLTLFQAVRDLLIPSKGGAEGKFVVISSALGSISWEGHYKGQTTYGTSKAAVNYLTRKIHFEEPELIAFNIDPGYFES
uniref:NAD(P)-binding protein n=1 Tax=Kwoniella dejecticola CBS 10117 TaxID=1296121 RepID=A0A1A6ACH8_9TREE|nr:uncharacterized protein I303_01976 [Kwoniella dejecticola CBS 10117]OBR87764.1 hypothetical protein I303_01976 [Kwoniella dejecticola CBS 10117]